MEWLAGSGQGKSSTERKECTKCLNLRSGDNFLVSRSYLANQTGKDCWRPGRQCNCLKDHQSLKCWLGSYEDGEVAERLNASVSKTDIPAMVSGVRIPPSPLQKSDLKNLGKNEVFCMIISNFDSVVPGFVQGLNRSKPGSTRNIEAIRMFVILSFPCWSVAC